VLLLQLLEVGPWQKLLVLLLEAAWAERQRS
jgi:hypothetical protein